MPSWFTVVCAMFPLLWILLNNNFGFTGAVSHSRNSLSSANNHKINPKPCSVNGLEGICMFVWECINTEGKHIGMCVDTFMFGSCCAHNLTASQISQIPDTSEPAILYTQHNNNNNLKPTAANRPTRPRPKPSPTTARPALYLPNHNDVDRVSSSNARPVHNQIRPNNAHYNDHLVNNLYNSIDKSDVTLWSSSQSPSQHQHHHHHQQQQQQQHHYAPSSPHPTPSQHFHNSLPDRINAPPPQPSHSKPHHQITSQTSTKSPSTTSSPPSFQVWTIASNAAANAATHTTTVHSAAAVAASNLRPNFVSRPTILSTVLPAQHYQNSSHFVALTPSSGNATHADGAPNDNSNNQNNWESNEIDDISNAIDINGIYPFRPHHWHTSTSAPYMSWTKSSSRPPPQFITKPKPWSYTNKYSYSFSTATTAYGSGGVSTSTTAASASSAAVPVTSSTTTTTTNPPSTSTASLPSSSPATFAANSNKFPIYKPFSNVNTNLPSSTITSVVAASSTISSFTPKPHGSMTHLVSASTADKGTQCGISPMQTPRHEIRIVGGRNAQFGVWAWQVSVRRTSFFGFSSTHRCGGALLNENWIATAGHCVDDLLTSQIKIRVGEYDFSSIQEPYPFAERGVARKVVHPKYNFFTYEYDLAMVRLDSPLEYAPHIVPICLPGSDDLLIGENATVTGWGRLSEGGTLPSVLQEVSVPIVSNDKCKNMFLRAGRQEHIPDIFMCAGFDNGGRDSCQGDSGGPLQVKGKDGRYFLAGIISWGIGCAEANLPGVCTRISKFVPWILQTVT